MPVRLRSHMAVEKDNQVAGCSISSRFLGPDQSNRLIVAFDQHFVFPLYVRTQVGLRQWRVTAIIHHDNFMQNICGCGLKDRSHGVECKVALLGARKNYGDGLRRPLQVVRIRVQHKIALASGSQRCPRNLRRPCRRRRLWWRRRYDLGTTHCWLRLKKCGVVASFLKRGRLYFWVFYYCLIWLHALVQQQRPNLQNAKQGPSEAEESPWRSPLRARPQPKPCVEDCRSTRQAKCKRVWLKPGDKCCSWHNPQ
mmetsp:Transcript_20453/g.48527  ORF Transcript_20453/g.48527 Transcript_20453/m.48527 type:complete len:253 (+) Transcript_20453:1505-2263(+)